MQPPLLETFRRLHKFAPVAMDAFQRVAAAVVHGGGQRHRAGKERLHLIGAKAVSFQPQRKIQHVLVGGAGMGGDEVGDQILLLASLFRELVEQGLKPVVRAEARFHHLGQRPGLGVLGRDLEIAADVVGDQLADVSRIADRQIVAQAGRDQDFFDARQLSRLAVESDQR